MKSSCLTISGDLDVQTLFFLSCPTGHVSGTLQVTGTFTANANGTFTDATTTTGTEMLTLPAACKVLSGAPVTCDRIGSVMAGSYYTDATCVDSASGGGCDCTGTVNQTGSLGHVVGDPQTDGNFTTGSNTLTITQDSMKYGYCVSGTMLTLTPQGSSPTTTGSIVLQSGSTSGTGGSTGGGGKGGSTGAGGTGATGGKAGNGGGGHGTGGSAGGTGTGGTQGTKGHGAVRHLRGCQHALRGRVQHGSLAFEQVRRSAVPGPESQLEHEPRDRRQHDGRAADVGRLRGHLRPGHVLQRHDLHGLDSVRPVRQRERPQVGSVGPGRKRVVWGRPTTSPARRSSR